MVSIEFNTQPPENELSYTLAAAIRSEFDRNLNAIATNPKDTGNHEATIYMIDNSRIVKREAIATVFTTNNSSQLDLSS